MPSATKFYAWVNPLKSLPSLDHTWVTTFDAPFACAGGPPQDFWYCWGDCHPAGPGTTATFLRQATGDLDVARCICKPNEKTKAFRTSAGGINLYGLDGVCHQLANRILFGTADADRTPIKVEGARGYVESVILYGEYGVDEDEWLRRKKRCAAGLVVKRKTSLDTFARERLGSAMDAKTWSAVRDLEKGLRREKAGLDARVRAGLLTGRAFAQQTNDLVNAYRARFAVVLGVEDFQRVFESFPEERVDIVDPSVAAQIDYAAAGDAVSSAAIHVRPHEVLHKKKARKAKKGPARSQGTIHPKTKKAKRKPAAKVASKSLILKSVRSRKSSSFRGPNRTGPRAAGKK